MKRGHTERSGRICATILVGAVLILAPRADAQDTEQEDRYSVSELGLNFDVPESPAFTVLDLNPQNVTRSATPRDFAAAVINGLDRNGNFQSGLSLEFNPWGITNRNFFVGHSEIPVSNDSGTGYADGDFTLWNYDQPTRLMRNLIYRSAVSFATTKGAQSEDDALRMAAGLRMTPWDPGDSRLILGQCLIEKVESIRGVIHLMSNADLEARPAGTEGATLESLARTIDKSDLSSDDGKEFKDAIAAISRYLPPPAEGPAHEALPISDARQLRKIADAIGKHLTVESSGSAIETIRAELEEAQNGVFVAGSPERLGAVTKRLDGFVRTIDRYYDQMREDAVERANADAATSSGGTAELAERARRAAAVLDAAEAEKNRPHSDSDGIDDKAAKKAADAIVTECKVEEEGRWSGSSWDLSFAPSWISEDGNTSSFKWNGAGIWSSLSLGSDVFDLLKPNKQVGGALNEGEIHYAQVILHARYRFAERVEEEITMMDANGMETEMKNDVDQDTWLVGARLRLLLPGAVLQGRFGTSFEGSISNTDVSGKAANLNDDTYYRFALVPTIRITDNLWIDVAFGTETGRKTGNEAFVLSSLKYGYGQAPWPSDQPDAEADD